jgi:hypothetical protein
LLLTIVRVTEPAGDEAMTIVDRDDSPGKQAVSLCLRMIRNLRTRMGFEESRRTARTLWLRRAQQEVDGDSDNSRKARVQGGQRTNSKAAVGKKHVVEED